MNTRRTIIPEIETAIRLGQTAKFIELVAQVEFETDDWKQLARLATWQDSIEILQLIDVDCDHCLKEFVFEDGDTLLHIATSHKSNAVCKWLVDDKGINVNVTNEGNQTPPMLANQQELLGFYIERGGDINRQCDYGSSALHHSARYGMLENVELLIRSGVNLEARNARGEVALFWATRFPKVLRLMLDAGASTTARTAPDGWTLASYAILCKSFESLQIAFDLDGHSLYQDLEVINSLIELANEQDFRLAIEFLLNWRKKNGIQKVT